MKYKVTTPCNIIGIGRAHEGQEIELSSPNENFNLILNGTLVEIKDKTIKKISSDDSIDESDKIKKN